MKALFQTSGLRRQRARSDRRGVALLFALMAMMILTVLVTDMRFAAQVRFLGASHTRDEAVALGLANSGISIYRLILLADRQMSGNTMIRSMLMGRTLSDILPIINTGLLRMVFAEGGDVEEEDVEAFNQTGEVSEEVREKSIEASSKFGSTSFLDIPGEFSASISGEDCKLNLNTLSTHTNGQSIQELPVAQLLYRMMSTEENMDWLRDRNLDPWDLIANIVDWVDADDAVSSGKGGYEDEFYSRLSSPYLAKNAPFDTKEELRLVEGWQDEVYARFADQLSIYGSSKININCADSKMVQAMIQSGSTRIISDSEMSRIMDELNNYRMATYFQKASDACTWFKSEVPDMDTTSFCKTISTSTKVFSIESTGIVGDTAVTIHTVISYDSVTGSKEGKFLYWRIQ